MSIDPEMSVVKIKVVMSGSISTGRVKTNIFLGMSPISCLADLTLECGVMEAQIILIF